jgi:hypothetical protein
MPGVTKNTIPHAYDYYERSPVRDNNRERRKLKHRKKW